jgi:hypothetical protein
VHCEQPVREQPALPAQIQRPPDRALIGEGRRDFEAHSRGWKAHDVADVRTEAQRGRQALDEHP